jgi:hypothetical protein
MTQQTKIEQLPLEVSDRPWLYETATNKMAAQRVDVGKWMLFYDKTNINESWLLAKKLFREQKLQGVLSMKCSTNYVNPRASTNNSIIILFCSDSSNEEKIMSIGKQILEMFSYKEKPYIYYKTDMQTFEGTIATGTKTNHTYKLSNPQCNHTGNLHRPIPFR